MGVSSEGSRQRLLNAVIQLKELEALAKEPGMTGFQAQLYFDRAIDIASVAAETLLRELGLSVPNSSTDRIRRAIAELEAAGRGPLPDVEDLLFGIEMRNRSVHEMALNRAAKAQLRNALSNSRKLVKAILAELFGRNRN